MLYAKNHIFFKSLLIFSGIFLGIFIVTFSVLGYLGFIPTEFEGETRDNTVASELKNATLEGLGFVPASPIVSAQDHVSSTVQGQLPSRLVASSIDLDTTVVVPASTNYTLLDNALTRGAVYYPSSGLAGNGNMFIFGHSTSFQYVSNKAFKVFNNIKNLKKGDKIEIYGTDKVYVYSVRGVKLVNATEEAIVFSMDKNMLTLTTCNSFGQKTDRYVAEADLVTTRAIEVQKVQTIDK